MIWTGIAAFGLIGLTIIYMIIKSLQSSENIKSNRDYT